MGNSLDLPNHPFMYNGEWVRAVVLDITTRDVPYGWDGTYDTWLENNEAIQMQNGSGYGTPLVENGCYGAWSGNGTMYPNFAGKRNMYYNNYPYNSGISDSSYQTYGYGFPWFMWNVANWRNSITASNQQRKGGRFIWSNTFYKNYSVFLLKEYLVQRYEADYSVYAGASRNTIYDQLDWGSSGKINYSDIIAWQNANPMPDGHFHAIAIQHHYHSDRPEGYDARSSAITGTEYLTKLKPVRKYVTGSYASSVSLADLITTGDTALETEFDDVGYRVYWDRYANSPNPTTIDSQFYYGYYKVLVSKQKFSFKPNINFTGYVPWGWEAPIGEPMSIGGQQTGDYQYNNYDKRLVSNNMYGDNAKPTYILP